MELGYPLLWDFHVGCWLWGFHWCGDLLVWGLGHQMLGEIHRPSHHLCAFAFSRYSMSGISRAISFCERLATTLGMTNAPRYSLHDVQSRLLWACEYLVPKNLLSETRAIFASISASAWFGSVFCFLK